MTDAEKLAELTASAKRILPTRDVRTPTGGMRTGDSLEVYARDWYALVRLAKRVVALEADKS